METIDKALTTGMKVLVVGITLIGFAWLAQYSLQTHGYSSAEVKALDDLIEAQMANDYLSQLEVSLYKNGGRL